MKKVKILLVDDSKDNRYLIRELLRETRFQVDVAQNGADGVARAMNKAYDLILMDLQMPVLDGIGATKQLRQRGYTRPIVALTSRTPAEDRGALLREGFDAHLTKPVSLANLLRTINSLLKASTAEVSSSVQV